MIKGRKQQQGSDMSEDQETLCGLKTVEGNLKMEMMAFEDGRWNYDLGSRYTRYFVRNLRENRNTYKPYFKGLPLILNV